MYEQGGGGDVPERVFGHRPQDQEHYNVEQLKGNPSKVYKRNYQKIRAQFTHALGKAVTKGPSKDLADR